MAQGKAAKKKAVGRRAIPYSQIEAMAKAGKSALEIAEKLDRTTKGADPSHSIRAILSRMRTVGWHDSEGKLRKLKVERVGQPKKKSEKKSTKKAVKKPVPKPTVAPRTETDGKTQAAGKDE